MLTKSNLLDHIPEHDCLSLFVISHGTLCFPTLPRGSREQAQTNTRQHGKGMWNRLHHTKTKVYILDDPEEEQDGKITHGIVNKSWAHQEKWNNVWIFHPNICKHYFHRLSGMIQSILPTGPWHYSFYYLTSPHAFAASNWLCVSHIRHHTSVCVCVCVCGLKIVWVVPVVDVNSDAYHFCENYLR